jgi:hypothetical protein
VFSELLRFGNMMPDTPPEALAPRSHHTAVEPTWRTPTLRKRL